MAANVATRVAFVVVLLAATAVPAAGSLVAGLPYQAHSFDDLDSWSQQLRKGVRWFKLDVGLADYASCSSSNSTWVGSKADCAQRGGGSSDNLLCCVAFRGDTSSLPALPAPFNVSTDLLALLADESLRAYFADSEAPVHISLDAVNVTGWQESNSGETKLLADFFTGLAATISKHALTVQPLLDHASNAWIVAQDIACASGSCSAQARALSALPWKAQTASGSFPPLAQDPKRRYAVLNTVATDYSSVCNASFPDSSRALSYPFIWWELQNQQALLSLQRQQLACKTLPASHSSLQKGMRIASNSQPEQFTVFSSSLLTVGRNVDFLTGERRRRPLLAALPADDSSATLARWLYLLSTAPAPQHSQQLAIMSLPSGAQALPTVVKTLSSLPIAAATTLSAAAAALDGKAALLLANSSAHWQLFAASSSSAALSAVHNGTLQAAAASASLLSATLLPHSDAIVVAAFATEGSGQDSAANGARNGDACQLSVAAFSLRQSNAAQASACVQSDVAVSNASIAMAAEPNADGSWAGLLAYSTDTVPPQLYAAHISFDAHGGFSVVNGSLSASQPLARLQFGAQPSVAVANVSNSLLALVVHSQGSCEWGEGFDNGDMNHCAITPLASPASLASVTNQLNYNYGTLQAWKTVIAQRQFTTGCSQLLMHASFDTGVHPSALLYEEQGQATMLELHNGNVTHGVADGLCGTANRHPGLVIDSFPLVQLDSLP